MKYLKILPVILFALSNLILAQGDPGQNSVLAESTNDFALSTLSAQGLDEEMVMAAIDSINNDVYSNIHSLLILKNNKLVYEKYFEGEDAIIGKGCFMTLEV